jgi:F-type H+-transporting ATPase subunit a
MNLARFVYAATEAGGHGGGAPATEKSLWSHDFALYLKSIGLHETVVMTWIIVAFWLLVGIAGFIIIRNNKGLVPGKIQNVFEALYELLESFVVDFLSEKGRKYIPLIGAFALFIVTCNLAGLFPALISPTANLNTTLALGISSVVLVQIIAIFTVGPISYITHFMGPSKAVAILLFPLEIISEFAKIISLSLRLFGNIFGKDTVMYIIFILVPIIAPLPLMLLAVLVGIVQTMVFTLLTMAYINNLTHIGEEEAHH